MKKAIIDQMMLAMVLFVAVLLFVATVADDRKAHSEIAKIRTVLQNAALASAKYYTYEGTSIEVAEAKANSIISNTNFGQSIENDLVYTWDLVSEPNNVVVTINDYTIDYFWYKFFSQDTSQAFSLDAKADIFREDSDEPICICGEAPGVGLVDRILCVVGTEEVEEVQIASDGSSWKVKSTFDNGNWEVERWYLKADVDAVYVITLDGDDQIQLNDLSIPSIVDAGCGDDQIQGSTGFDTIFGNEGNDQIQGSDGSDILYGGNGADQIQGGNGNDTLYIDGDDTTVDGGSGNNTISNGIGNTTDCNVVVEFQCTEITVILNN